MLVWAAALSFAAPVPAAARLRIATWNLEWLMTPQTHARLRGTCTRIDEAPRRGTRSIPCDVAAQPARTAADFERLRYYARILDADVVSLQETDGSEAARLVFTDYDFCFTRRVGVQNNGFAIRRNRGIRFACGPDWPALAMGHSQLRWGAELRLYPERGPELRVLSVHLKSGCAAQAIDDGAESCALLRAQIEPLSRWIETQRRAHVAFMLAGDFNRRGPMVSRAAPSWWDELVQQTHETLVDAGAGQRYRKCHFSEPHRGAIDHLIADAQAAAHWRPDSFRQVWFSETDAARFRLSDHCAISIDYE